MLFIKIGEYTMIFIYKLNEHNIPVSEVPIFLWIIIGLALAIQGGWIFNDASKRGENKWLWGIYGLMNIPTSLIVYLIVTRKALKQTKCENCNKNINSKFNYCPYCAKKIVKQKEK
jgi:hypothetical protein